MWVFDGETWIQEDSETLQREVTEHHPPLDIEMAELLVVEAPCLTPEPRAKPAARMERNH